MYINPKPHKDLLHKRYRYLLRFHRHALLVLYFLDPFDLEFDVIGTIRCVRPHR